MATANTEPAAAGPGIDDADDLLFFDAPEQLSTDFTEPVEATPKILEIVDATVRSIPNHEQPASYQVSGTLGTVSSIGFLEISRAGISGRSVEPSNWGTYNGRLAAF